MFTPTWNRCALRLPAATNRTPQRTAVRNMFLTVSTSIRERRGECATRLHPPKAAAGTRDSRIEVGTFLHTTVSASAIIAEAQLHFCIRENSHSGQDRWRRTADQQHTQM